MRWPVSTNTALAIAGATGEADDGADVSGGTVANQTSHRDIL
jgi:hypothetical protein